MRICTVDGCERRHYATGLCSIHYQRRFKGKPLDGPVKVQAKASMTTEDRLLVALPDRPEDGCWPWTRAVTKAGYGKIGFNGNWQFAHRVAYEEWIGPIPDGLHILHSCDNPPCCNPAHLMIGSHSDNMADMMAKGRQQRGESSGKSPLTEGDVRAIRADPRINRVIAEDYGVTSVAISRIKRRARWGHIE